MVKCFDIQRFKALIQQKYRVNAVEKDAGAHEEYANKLINQFEETEEDKQKKIFMSKMEADGFSVVVDHAGDVDLTGEKRRRALEQLEEQEAEKRRRKKNKGSLTDFYKFQVHNSEAKKNIGINLDDDSDEGNFLIDEKEIDDENVLKKAKKVILKRFEKDKEKLRKKFEEKPRDDDFE